MTQDPLRLVAFANVASPHLDAWRRVYDSLGAEVRFVDTHHGWRKLICDARAARKFARNGVTGLHGHGAGRASFVMRCMFPLAKQIVVVHGSEVLRRRETRRSAQLMTWVVLRIATHVVTTAQATSAAVGAWTKHRSIHTVHPGIDWDVYLSAITASSKGPTRVSSIRRVLPMYRINEIVEATRLQLRDQAVQLTILTGDTQESDSHRTAVIEEATAELQDSVTVIDHFLDDAALRLLLATTDIAISVAESDQMSSIILEALAAGCHVIASDLDAYSAISGLSQVTLVSSPAKAVDISLAIAEVTAAGAGVASAETRRQNARKARAAVEAAYPSGRVLKELFAT